MYRYTSRSWGVQMGLRNEYTEWNTQQRVKTQLHNSRSDNNIFPSFFVKKTWDKEMLCRLVIRNR